MRCRAAGCWGVLLGLVHSVMSSLEPKVQYSGPGARCAHNPFTPKSTAFGGQCTPPETFDPCSTGYAELCVGPDVFVELFVYARTSEPRICEASSKRCHLTKFNTGHWSCDLRDYCGHYSDYDLVFTFLKGTQVLCYEQRVLPVCSGPLGCSMGLFGTVDCSDFTVGFMGYVFAILLAVGVCVCAFIVTRVVLHCKERKAKEDNESEVKENESEAAE